MKKIAFTFAFILFNTLLFAQTKEQAIMALRTEEHTKVSIEENTVIFNDHHGALENIESYEYLALELAEGLYHQMSDQTFTPYFNALFSEGYVYQNIIDCKNGITLNLNASPEGIGVKITKYPEGVVADEYYEF
ncbi:hypothetical protein [Flammeovirga sp. OC4]|uniref:hypothetical protein n=1 Tax=Flammeovirga sp. OC4 TaxID=1382345 RepID=UPI0005C75944|nr:hypothetical protein [Flammeovirga sp. OC4]